MSVIYVSDRCGICSKITPSPTDVEICEFAEIYSHTQYMKPGPLWMPDGWSISPYDCGLRCYECTENVIRDIRARYA